MDHPVKIGCIGPSDSIGIIMDVVRQYDPGVILTPYVEEEICNAHKRLDQCQAENAGILFTGIGVQEAARAGGEIRLPCAHIPRGGYSLIRALWDMDAQNRKQGRKIRCISMDVVTRNTVSDVTGELGMVFDDIYVQSFDAELTEPDYEHWHRELYAQGRTQAMISGFGAVYDQLKKDGLPVFRLYPSRFEIRENLDRLKAGITAENLRSAGIAVQIIHLASLRRDVGLQYDILKKQGLFYLELLEYVRALRGSVFQTGREYVIYSTRGGVEDPAHMEGFKALLGWGEKQKIRIASGIGVGRTAFEAEKSARKALGHARKIKENAFFIVNRDQVRGPLLSSGELSYPMCPERAGDVDIARRIGITPGYLARVRALIDKTGQTVFDAQDLASCLGVSQRSARRILKKFTDSGYGRRASTETAGRAGRPKQLIELNI
ncbi:MAG: hypothetical protein V6Z89_22680 [Desulfobacter sp.]